MKAAIKIMFFVSRTLIKTIICGQILSLTLCGVGTTSAALAKWYNVRVPGFQAFLTYTLICLTAGTKLAFDSKKFKEVIKERGWKYLLLGIADVEANFLLVKAYTFTTLTSAQVRRFVVFLPCFFTYGSVPIHEILRHFRIAREARKSSV